MKQSFLTPLDLAERGKLGLNQLTEQISEADDYEMYSRQFFDYQPPRLRFFVDDLGCCQPKALEYAGRAGGAGSTSAKPQDLDKVAWYQDNSRLDQKLSEQSFSADDYAPRPVGSKKPNRWGFYDMLGNVGEGCADLYQTYISEFPHVEVGTSETRRPPIGLRILRGGAYADPLSLISPTFRYADRPTHAFRWVGVRLARSVPASE